MVDPLSQIPTMRVPPPIAYFNGFGVAVTNADLSLQIRLDNQPMMELKASYTVMKTLAEGLAKAIDGFEKATGKEIMTTEFVETALRASNMKTEQP